MFSENHDLFVQTLLFMGMRVPGSWWLRPDNTGPGLQLGQDLEQPFFVAWPDVGSAIRAALEVELVRLPSRCEDLLRVPAHSPRQVFQ